MSTEKNDILTPEEFRDRMLEYSRMTNDVEVQHIMMDGLMCDLLKSLGYEGGVDVFRGTYKWYA